MCRAVKVGTSTWKSLGEVGTMVRPSIQTGPMSASSVHSKCSSSWVSRSTTLRRPWALPDSWKEKSRQKGLVSGAIRGLRRRARRCSVFGPASKYR